MRELIELAKKATEEGWDAYKIMAEFCSAQKEIDAKLVEALGYPEIAEAIRKQQ